MKRFLLSAILIFLAIQGFAQKDSTKTDTTLVRTIQSLADERAKKLLPQYAPLSPSAAAFQKFGDYQVNLATGIVPISIPIYTIKVGSLSIPISVDYHTSGFKLNEQASLVGLGWALNYGPSLNRTVQGLKDDNSGGSYLTNPITASKDFCYNNTDYYYGQSVVQNQMDTQPDIFSYSLGGSNGKFLLGQNGASPFKIPDYPVQISYSGTPSITSFDLVNDDGVAFRFGGVSSALESQSVISGFTTQNYISSWLISEVKSPDTDDLINYSYQSGGHQYLTEKQWVSSMILNAVPHSGGYYQNNQNSVPTFTNATTTIAQSNPHKITYENGEVEFIQSAVGERLDLTNSHFLKQINIYNYENGSKNLLKVVKFTYSYFTHNGVNKRLKLDKVSFEDAQGIVQEPYIPEYWTNTLSWNDNLDNEKIDFFGYYNGKPNTHLIPVGSYQGVPIVGGAADRSTVDTYMKDGVIKRLNFPTGGYTEFDFETNRYFNGTANVFAGGLRLKSIKSVAGTSSFMKRYEYASNAGLGIGRIPNNWTPTSATLPNIQELLYLSANVIYPDTRATQASFTQNSGPVDFSTLDAAPVYYTDVTEYFEEATDPTKNGKNVYTFDFRADLTVNAINYTTRDVQPWKRGNLLSKMTYDANNNLKESLNNSYQELNNDTRLAIAFIKVPSVWEGSVPRPVPPCTTQFISSTTVFPGALPEMIYATAQYQTGIMLLGSTSTVTDNVSLSKLFTYNNKLSIAQTQTDDSKTGDFLTEIFKYPFDPSFASDPIAQQLIARNQLNPILENEIQETVSGVTNTIYKEKKVYNSFTGNNARGLTNNILPAEIWVAPMGLTFEKRVEFKNYDAFGNLLTYEVDGQPTTLVWGYNNSLVSCIAKNATLSQVNAALSSTGLSPSAFAVSSLSIGQENTLQNFKNALPNSLIDWYVYKPHIGLSQSFAPNALKTNYFYDSHQRFSKATDHEGNILQTNFYKISPNENYIVSAKPRIATTNDILAGLFFNSVVDYQYFDGLGRPTQAIGIGQSPDQNSIIKSETYYDKFNRQFSSLLPISAGALTYTPIANAKILAQNFYADVAPSDSTIFEFSPLNRPKATFGVGNAWRIADKKTQVFYESGGSEVRNYSVNSSGNLVLSGTYPANSLFKKRILDEQGNESIEYTDKRGRMIEKRQQLETGVYAHTHYVYDGLGRAKAIIQPMGYELNTGFTYNSTDFQNWVFFYNYDSRGRNNLKHVPAAGFTKMVYDRKDRLVMQQDALQASLGKWNFWKYDAFDREVMRGETVAIGNTQPYWQGLFDLQTHTNETWLPASNYYDELSFPSQTNISYPQIKLYNLYDAYDLNYLKPFEPSSAYHSQYPNARGLLTGRVNRDLSLMDQGQFRYYNDTYYYDSKNRVIQTFETHDMGGANNHNFANKTDIEYNFVGEVMKSRMVLRNANAPDKTLLKQYTYDHVGRKIEYKLGINGATPETIAKYFYDAIGRQSTKWLYPNRTYQKADSLLDYINRPPSPAPNTTDVANRAINLLPGTIIDSTYLACIDTMSIANGTVTGIQKMDYQYHIRGLQNCINCIAFEPVLNAAENDFFASKLEWETAGRFDGNIGKQSWRNKKDYNSKSYTHSFDAFSRLKSAIYSGNGNEDYSLPNLSYDKNGNILNLTRKGFAGSSFSEIDDLNYSYTGNKLNKIDDAVSGNQNTKDFRDSVSVIDYTYWPNGNLKSDLNKRISQIDYNTYLNKPQKITFFNGSELIFNYDGSGTLIKRQIPDSTKWVYTPSEIYKNDSLYQISQDEGRILQKNGNFKLEFEYRDLWGNLRTAFTDSDSLPVLEVYHAPIITQINDYDLLGFEHFNNQAGKNNFLFQKQERVFDLDLGWDFWKYRPSDAVTGRFMMPDPLSSQFPYNSVYALQENKFGKGVELEGAELKEFGNWISKKIDQALTFTDADDVTVLVTTVSRGGNAVHVDGQPATNSDKVFAAGGLFLPAVSGGAVKKIFNAVTNIKANQAAGAAREVAEHADLVKANPGASVQNQQYLRTADGKIAKDPVSQTGRRVDHVVIKDGKATDVVETTSQNANKLSQERKEGRIRETGGTFIRDRNTKELIDLKDSPTRTSRRD